jgi:hypothetical protein
MHIHYKNSSDANSNNKPFQALGVASCQENVMRIYYDTEFTNIDGNIDWDMISAGFVAADGREWYAEIEDFNRKECSLFVVETVLPLLGRTPAERLLSREFGNHLAQWLATFDEDIELISDARCDWWLVNSMAEHAFDRLPRKVRGRVWSPAENTLIHTALQEAELLFWQDNPGLEHHALYDARRLKLLADLQRHLDQD